MPHETHAALQRLLDEAPHVRLLARSLLAEDADEVVQQTWLQAVQHGGVGVDQPRPWLSRIVRNVAANLLRGRSRRRVHESERSEPGMVPSSAELFEREEQRRRLVAAVDRLPGHLRAVIVLRFFEGMAPRTIAERLDLPGTTVWNRTREAMELLRERLDREHGGRRAWALPLAVFAREPALPPPPTPAPPFAPTTLVPGVLAMTAKTKIAAVVALAFAGTVLWWQMDPGTPSALSPPTQNDTANAAAGTFETAANQRDSQPNSGAEPRREAIDPVPAPTTGSLVVNVRYERDQAPATGVTMLLRRPGHGSRFGVPRQRTDTEGKVSFANLTPQRVVLTTEQGQRGKSVEVAAGAPTAVDYEIPIGLDVTGIVVDATGVPVAGALVEYAPYAHADVDSSTATVTDVNGRFTLRDLQTECLVGARAHGYRASQLAFLMGKKGNTADIRLELGNGGGSVDGIVVDHTGEPVPDAFVVIGAGEVNGIACGLQGAPPLPASVRTDSAGRFRAIGIPAGKQRATALAANLAPWHGECEISANLTVSLRIAMQTGSVLRGIVLGPDEAPVAGADVRVGDSRDLDCKRTLSAPDGTFELTGLPEGAVALHVRQRDHGKAELTVATSARQPTECVVRLSRGLVLQGRVVDENGNAIANAFLECHASDVPWSGNAHTDAEGGFVVANCPQGHPMSLRIRANGYETVQRDNVDSDRGTVEIRMSRLPPASVRIRGRVLDDNGDPLANAMMSRHLKGSREGSGVIATGPDGVFEFGLVVPGTWNVSVNHPQFPEWQSEWRELRTDDESDLGDIHLQASGRARVRVNGNRAGVDFRVVDRAQQGTTDLLERDGLLHSAPLAAGTHDLFVSGGTTACQAILFEVTAGEIAEFTVDLQPGVLQKVECDTRALGEGVRGVVLTVRRGNVLVARRWVGSNSGKADCDLRLLPGDYTLEAFDGDRRVATEPVHVGSAPADPVRLVAR